jgi:putative phosphoesterase
MRIGLISDTHGTLRNEVFDHFDGVAHILHAGDIGDPDILTALSAVAPVAAVWGNTDGNEIRMNVQETVTLEAAGRTIMVVHGHRLGSPTPAGLDQAHPGPDIIVFGHTHKPAFERIGSRLFINPGSAGQPRFGLKPSIAVLTLEDGREEFRIILI